VSRSPGVDLVRLFAQLLQLFLAFAARRLGDFAVLLGVNDENRFVQLGADFLQIFSDDVAVPRIVHHDEEHGLLPELLMFGIALTPFFDAKAQIVGILFRDYRAVMFG